MKFGIIPTSPAEAKLSELRLSICGECPFVGESKVLRIINGEFEQMAQMYCTKCKCPCIEKSLVTDEKCPVNNW